MLISKAVNSEDTGKFLEEPSKKASGTARKTKAPLVVSGVVAKKPRRRLMNGYIRLGNVIFLSVSF